MARKLIGMARSIDPTRSWPRRWRALLSLVVLVGAGVVFMQTVLAVHDSTPFELDTIPGTPDPPGGPGADVVTSNSATFDDWDEVCFAETGDARCGTNGALSTTVTASFWSADCPQGFSGDVMACGDFTLPDGVPAAKDATVFTGGGSKDPQPIENWLWKNGAVPQKNNLVHAFAVRYSVPSNTDCPALNPDGSSNTDGTLKCDVLYFGSDRWDNDGSAQQGFWFLQSPISLNGAVGGGGTRFTGTHTPDDVLVVSDFAIGGTVSHITVYKWDPACLGAGKPFANCGAENLRRLTPLDSESNCYDSTGPDAFCGVVNAVDNGGPPWPFRDAEGSTTYRANELFEAGVNLSAFPGLSGKCFATVVAETRSTGSSFTGTNQDFVLGSFGECTSGMVTAPLVPTGRTVSTVIVGDQVSDQVTQLNITGIDSWTGVIKFFVCTPSELDDAGTLPNGDPDDPNTCDIGGTKLGDDINVKGNPINPGLPITSTAAVTANAVGTWCFRGEFDSLTTDLPDASDSSTGECFTVIVLQPSLSTAQTWTVKDSATVTVASGGGNLTGNLRFKLYQNVTGSDCTTGTLVYDSDNIAVSGASPVTMSTDDAPATATGSLVFTATPPPSGALKWLVTYVSTNSAHKNVTHACGGENSTLTIANGSTSTTP